MIKMEQLKRIFNFVISIQVMMFLFFILDNLYELDNISYSYDIDGNVETFSFNFYNMLGILVAILVVAALVGFSIFGAGFNDTSTVMIRKYMALGALISILFVCSNYYILQLGLIGVIINIFFFAAYAFKVIDIMGGDKTD